MTVARFGSPPALANVEVSLASLEHQDILTRWVCRVFISQRLHRNVTFDRRRHGVFYTARRLVNRVEICNCGQGLVRVQMIDTGSAQITDSSRRAALVHIFMSRYASLCHLSRCCSLRLLWGAPTRRRPRGSHVQPGVDVPTLQPILIWANARTRQEAVEVESHVPVTNEALSGRDGHGYTAMPRVGYKHPIISTYLTSRDARRKLPLPPFHFLFAITSQVRATTCLTQRSSLCAATGRLPQ